MHATAILLRAVALGGLFTVLPLAVLAQDDDQDSDQTNWNHFGLDFTMGINIKARFMNAGEAPPAPPSAGDAVNRGYTDGFVNVDSSRNAGGETWNWGYQHASQISGDTLLLHADALSASSGNSADNNNPHLGFEFSYVRDLGHETWGRWGLKAAFGYTDINLSSSGSQSVNGELITDTYQLNGITPPVAPYVGSFSGPGPVIGSSPTRAITPEVAIITGNRSVDANLFDFHFGPTADVYLTRRLSVELGGGFAFGVVNSTFDFNETTTTASGFSNVSGNTDNTGCVVGAYAEAGLAYRVCREASLYAGAEFQYLGDFDQSAEGNSVQLDLNRSVFFLLGVEVHF
jgi:hypothetical protein